MKIQLWVGFLQHILSIILKSNQRNTGKENKKIPVPFLSYTILYTTNNLQGIGEKNELQKDYEQQC